VGEIFQGPVHSTQKRPEAPEELGRLGIHLPEGHPGEPGENAGEVSLPLGTLDLLDFAPVRRMMDPGDGEPSPPQMLQGPVLKVQYLSKLLRLSQSQHESSIRRFLPKEEVLVPVRRELLCCGDRDGEPFRGDPDGFLRGEIGTGTGLLGHGLGSVSGRPGPPREPVPRGFGCLHARILEVM
jgi:hypothetical protein